MLMNIYFYNYGFMLLLYRGKLCTIGNGFR